MPRVILARNWKAKGARLPKTVAARKAASSKRVRVVKPRKGHK
jgi:hypothetical protein